MTCKIISWLFLLSSIPCVCLIIQTHFSTKSAHKVHGTVVDHITSARGKGGRTYSLRVAYRETKTEVMVNREWYVENILKLLIKYNITDSAEFSLPHRFFGRMRML